jgi:enolase
MPLPMVNMISGGLHAGGNLDFQDFLLMPVGAKTFSEALEVTGRVYRELQISLRANNYEAALVGDEGGFGPRLEYDWQAIEYLSNAIKAVGLEPWSGASIALDVASTHFYVSGNYNLRTYRYGEGAKFNSFEMAKIVGEMADHYPIMSIEDGCAEDDWYGWGVLTERIGSWIQLIGDDLFVTNPERLKLGIEKKVANSILIKLNQIGTLTETLQVIDMARAAGYRPVISARSGETEDSTIADLAVATGAGQIKIGSVARSERLAKYNQLLRIEEELPGPENFGAWQPVGRP